MHAMHADLSLSPSRYRFRPSLPWRAHMPGVTGRQVVSAFAKSNTWAVPATVTQQVLIMNTEGFDNMPMYDTDEAFTQDYLGQGEVSDDQPITPTLAMTMRFEQGVPTFIAAAMGSAAAPSVVSSQAATSLVAYSHVITMADELVHFYTFANKFGSGPNYVQELRTAKPTGFSIRVGNNGRMEITFPFVGDKTVYTPDALNTGAMVDAATISTPGNRAFRRNVRLRMNVQSGGALGSTDEVTVAREFALDVTMPVARDHVLNQSYIYDPDDDGWWDGNLEVTYARMNTNSANSLVRATNDGIAFKADLFFQGTNINSTTRRSMLFEMPMVEPQEYRSVVSGHNLLRPVVRYKLKKAGAAPTGMSGLTRPLRITIINGQSTNLITMV
jgi:hypothetical protein